MRISSLKVDVHDIIKLNSICESKFDMQLPDWTAESLRAAPFVVIRRGKAKKIQGNNYFPIGIRGQYREERFGCFMLEENCQDIITPEQIIANRMWVSSCDAWKEVLERLEKLFGKWESKLVWGVSGSVGFELVTKLKVTSLNSDLDIVIKPNKPLTVEEAKQILVIIQESSSVSNCIIDANMKTNKGWITLREYAAGIGTYLIKTETGEELVNDIW